MNTGLRAEGELKPECNGERAERCAGVRYAWGLWAWVTGFLGISFEELFRPDRFGLQQYDQQYAYSVVKRVAG